MKIPLIELSECILCEVCRSVCPEVFILNDLGFIQVEDLPAYPKDAVDESIKNCPVQCIYWSED